MVALCTELDLLSLFLFDHLASMIMDLTGQLQMSLSLIDNIFVQFGGRLFRWVIGIPMGTNCAPLLDGLLLYSYENEFLVNMIRSGHRRLAQVI